MKKRLFLIFSVFCAINLSGQSVAYKRSFNEAQSYLFYGNYGQALKYLAIAYKSEPDNSNVNHLIGLCIINSPVYKEKAIPYLLKAIKNVSKNYNKESYKERNAPPEAYLYLGQAYHYDYQFDKALEAFNKYKSFVEDGDETRLKAVNQYIDWCINAKELIKNPAEIKITNLKDINSKYDDHTPVINSDESVLIFTSRRPGGTGNLRDDDGRYFEDIYISKKINGKWSIPTGISSNINTTGHEATIALSADGKELFIYKDDDGIGNIYSSTLNDNKEWSKPQKLGSNINTSSNETHASISTDKNILAFVSDRKNGYGKTDIYIVRKLPNGEWGLAQNIGNIINTEYEENGVFIHPNGKSLFFSSKGHNSMGGYDLFYSQLNDDSTWTKPVNLGYPINTTGDDIFYVLSTDGRRAYYSSQKEDGMGGIDIYKMDLVSLSENSSTVIRGYVKISGTKEIVKKVKITVYDKETNRIVGIYRPNKTTGIVTMILKQGKDYKITFEDKNYKLKKTVLFVPGNTSFFELHSPLWVETIGSLEKK